MRITVLVFNSVLHDIRVLKEANSLAHAGHDVSIIGLLDKRVTSAKHQLSSGVRIRLWQTRFSDAIKIITKYIVVGLGGLILLLLVLSGFSSNVENILSFADNYSGFAIISAGF